MNDNRNTVILSVTDATKVGRELVFQDFKTCIVGRALNCSLRIPNVLMHHDVSRHHCLLIIDPPKILLRDLGSLNGTFINGEKFSEKEELREIRDGDVIRLASSVELDVHSFQRVGRRSVNQHIRSGSS